MEDLLAAIGGLREEQNTFLVQCSAHVQVHLVTERYHTDVFVIDTFIYPTKELGLLLRNDVGEHKSLGIVSATRGYLDLSRFETIVDQPSKPVVARNLLAGEFDAGLTHVHYVEEHPEELRLVEYDGAVDTTWVVYGAHKRFRGAVIGRRVPELFASDEQPAPTAARSLA